MINMKIIFTSILLLTICFNANSQEDFVNRHQELTNEYIEKAKKIVPMARAVSKVNKDFEILLLLVYL